MPSGVSAVAIGVAVAALAAALLMLLTEVTTVISIDVAVGSCDSIYDTNPDLADDCQQKGFERSSVALLLLALLTIAMGSGAAFGRSRPAAVALVVIGLVVLGITLGVDVPASDDTGLIGRRYAAAEATAETGLWLELVGGVLAVVAGLLRLLRPND